MRSNNVRAPGLAKKLVQRQTREDHRVATALTFKRFYKSNHKKKKKKKEQTSFSANNFPAFASCASSAGSAGSAQTKSKVKGI
jgi:hypothetical protein